MDDEKRCNEVVEDAGSDTKRKRGRPRKVQETQEEKASMQRYLQKGNPSTEMIFGKRDKITRSPVKESVMENINETKVTGESEVSDKEVEEGSKLGDDEEVTTESEGEEEEATKQQVNEEEKENRWKIVEERLEELERKVKVISEENGNLENIINKIREEGDKKAKEQEEEINELKGKIQMLLLKSEEKEVKEREELGKVDIDMRVNGEDVRDHEERTSERYDSDSIEEVDEGEPTDEKRNEEFRMDRIDWTNREST